jgi:hypothetical protein
LGKAVSDILPPAAIVPWAAAMAIAATSLREDWRRHEKRGGIAPAAPKA